MVFAKKKNGRPRDHGTAKECREATRLRKAAWEAKNVDARCAKRRARAAGNSCFLARSLSWFGINCTVNEMFQDTCFTYPLPADVRQAALFQQIKNLYLHIIHAFDDAPADWFSNTSQVLLRSRGAILQDHILFLQSVLRELQPYCRAMDITYDTFCILFAKEDIWGRDATHMAESTHALASNLRTLLDAWDNGTLKQVLLLGS
ncbi:hypothetical protein CYLTODRAFT_494900 [Cylindrobasidium torrendii FP15055 ss-10]|uniref:Uncharacterized protein n=1 Tax=Cylindrobasidium torrendii FP15055 ss-10 TaxID=1314674 RepID=A0A0D7AXQ5_9AGAR|nr:hypothetical protein CYLTODRAFT_494900 [Cylindrobasidium torrendii FP15055 ss-10]